MTDSIYHQVLKPTVPESVLGAKRDTLTTKGMNLHGETEGK